MLDRQTHFFITSLALAVALVAALTCCEATAAQTLGVMGDSLSDEYAYNGRSYATNWTEQLVNFDGVNLGALGSYPSPRNQGYAFNWALSGATSATVLSGGQASGLAAQIPTAGIDYGMLVIGANDFAGRFRSGLQQHLQWHVDADADQ